MMFQNTLSPATKKLLQKLTPQNLPRYSYLGGGTAIALQLGHRRSADLDFFSPVKFVEQQWEQKLVGELGFKVINRDWQTLTGAIGGVKVSVFFYKYKLVEKRKPVFKVEMASLEDLSAMKLHTIIGRGAKRDFVDIYFLAQKFTLLGMLDFYDKKYGDLEERLLMIKKGLIYFADADREPMPDMLAPANWERVKNWFLGEVKNL